MQIETLIEGVAATWWVAAIATFTLSLFGALLQPRIQERRPSSDEKPPVSLILPVKSLNPGFERAQLSAFGQNYTEYEVLVGAAEAESPALGLMRKMAAASIIPARVMKSDAIGAVSPKLDTLATPLEAAVYDVVVTKDSNISFGPNTLRAMIRGLAPGVGLVCAVPVGVRAQTMAGRIEAILINRDAQLLLTASAFGKGYGVGKVMAFRRSDLRRAGGVSALAYTIAEDTALSRALGKIGLKTCFAATTVDQEIGAPNLSHVYARQARWAVIRRAEEPRTFKFEPVACPLPAGFAAAMAAPLCGLSSIVGFGCTVVGWYLAEVCLTALKGWELRPCTPLAFLGRDAVVLTAWAKAWTTRRVVWAGRTYDVRDVLYQAKRVRW